MQIICVFFLFAAQQPLHLCSWALFVMHTPLEDDVETSANVVQAQAVPLCATGILSDVGQVQLWVQEALLTWEKKV